MFDVKTFVQNAKTKIIHFLGGYTAYDVEHERTGWETSLIEYGRRHAYRMMKEKADSLFGLEGDEWSKEMYDFIVKCNERR